ncbi:hypothetical protein [Rhodopila sp.]|nr:hypothetical protein [Rhodopila sp.]HVZ07149.1 hypothetical protein [Rhodopila sp.]
MAGVKEAAMGSDTPGRAARKAAVRFVTVATLFVNSFAARDHP